MPADCCLTLAFLAFRSSTTGHRGDETQLFNASMRAMASRVDEDSTYKKRSHCPVTGCKFADGGKTCRSYAAVTEHFFSVHSENKPFTCEVVVDGEECSQPFGTKGALRDHKRAKHRAGKLECTGCNNLFQNKRKLEAHANGLNKVISEGYKMHGLKPAGTCSLASIPLDTRTMVFHSRHTSAPTPNGINVPATPPATTPATPL